LLLTLLALRSLGEEVVPDPRVELGTPASSGQRSTDELVRLEVSAMLPCFAKASQDTSSLGKSAVNICRIFLGCLHFVAPLWGEEVVGNVGIEPTAYPV
jgi:hypothetical protein